MQEYFEMSGAELPEHENIRLYNKSRLDDSFPDEEINQVFSSHAEQQEEIENLTKSELLENLDKSILHESKSESKSESKLIPELTKTPESAFLQRERSR